MSFPHNKSRDDLFLTFPSSGTYYAEMDRPSGSLLTNIGSARRDLSIFIEFRRSSAPAATHFLFSMDTPASYVGVAVFLNTSGTIQCFNISSNPVQRIDIATTANLCDGNVHRVVITRDDTGTAAGLKIYVDSSAEASKTNPHTNSLTSDQYPTQAIRIGAVNGGSLATVGVDIGCVGVWDDVILSSSEIDKLMGDPRKWMSDVQYANRAFGVTWDDAVPGDALEGYRTYSDLDNRPFHMRPGMSFTRVEGNGPSRGVYTGHKSSPIGLIGTLNQLEEITLSGPVYPTQGMTVIGSTPYVCEINKLAKYSDLTFDTQVSSNTSILGDPSLPATLNHMGGLTADVARNEVLCVISEANQIPGAIAIFNGSTLALEDVIDLTSYGISNVDAILYDPDGPYIYIGSTSYLNRFDYDRATPSLSNHTQWWISGGLGTYGQSLGSPQGMWQLPDKSIVMSVIALPTLRTSLPGIIQIKEPVAGEALSRICWLPTLKSSAQHDEGLIFVDDVTTESGYKLYVSDATATTTVRVYDPILP